MADGWGRRVLTILTWTALPIRRRKPLLGAEEETMLCTAPHLPYTRTHTSLLSPPQPENAIKVKKFSIDDGSDPTADTVLYDLAPFLRALATQVGTSQLGRCFGSPSIALAGCSRSVWPTCYFVVSFCRTLCFIQASGC